MRHLIVFLALSSGMLSYVAVTDQDWGAALSHIYFMGLGVFACLLTFNNPPQ